jgi:gluconate kinase
VSFLFFFYGNSIERHIKVSSTQEMKRVVWHEAQALFIDQSPDLIFVFLVSNLPCVEARVNQRTIHWMPVITQLWMNLN